MSDLISREALKKDFEERNKACDKWILKAKDDETKIRAEATKNFICEVIMTINNAPSVCGNNPKWCESCISKGKCASTRPQGEWIEVDIKPMPYGGYTCNRKCNKCDYFTKEYRLNFCPNCGAKMLKDKEGGLV